MIKLSKRNKITVWSILIALILWMLLVAITYENSLPSDGSAYIGFPVNILTVEYNSLTDRYEYSWKLLGSVLNISFTASCFLLCRYFLKNRNMRNT